jgi:hypothetical protein
MQPAPGMSVPSVQPIQAVGFLQDSEAASLTAGKLTLLPPHLGCTLSTLLQATLPPTQLYMVQPSSDAGPVCLDVGWDN